MKIFLFTILLVICFASCNKKAEPVSIIFDTDIAPDYDDVGALAMLHAFADKGEAKILATISCNASESQSRRGRKEVFGSREGIYRPGQGTTQ